MTRSFRSRLFGATALAASAALPGGCSKQSANAGQFDMVVPSISIFAGAQR